MIIYHLIDVYELRHIHNVRRKIDHFLWFFNKDKKENGKA